MHVKLFIQWNAVSSKKEKLYLPSQSKIRNQYPKDKQNLQATKLEKYCYK